jgi:hypothetical protein
VAEAVRVLLNGKTDKDVAGNGGEPTGTENCTKEVGDVIGEYLPTDTSTVLVFDGPVIPMTP